MNDKVEADNKKALRKILIKKILKRTAWTIVVLYCFFWFIGVYGATVDKYIVMGIETYKSNRADKQYLRDVAERDRLWTADTIGGKTPEETMQMFIDALKANDAEKASKLLIVPQQEKQYLYLKEQLEKEGDFSKNLEYVLGVQKNGKKICEQNNTRCGFYYDALSTKASTSTTNVGTQTVIIVTPVGVKQTHHVDFRLNEFSGVWKVEN